MQSVLIIFPSTTSRCRIFLLDDAVAANAVPRDQCGGFLGTTNPPSHGEGLCPLVQQQEFSRPQDVQLDSMTSETSSSSTKMHVDHIALYRARGPLIPNELASSAISHKGYDWLLSFGPRQGVHPGGRWTSDLATSRPFSVAVTY